MPSSGEEDTKSPPPVYEIVYERFLKNALVWVDLELTGLDPERDKIVEIAVILSDLRLTRIVRGPSLVIKTQPEALSPWCSSTFATNGLLEEMQRSSLSVKEAEDEVLEFVKNYIPDEGQGILAGSSVHVDRLFLIKHMPRLVEHLHYRIVDVSTIKTLAWAWLPHVMDKESEFIQRILADSGSVAGKTPSDDPNLHRAMADIERSIAALRYYKNYVFREWRVRADPCREPEEIDTEGLKVDGQTRRPKQSAKPKQKRYHR